MSGFTTHTLDTVSAEGRETLEQVKAAYGFVPNLLANLVESPAAAQAYLSIGKLFGETSFSETERQVVLLAVSRFNECEYCIAAHSAIAEMGQVPAEVVEALRNDRPLADPRLETLRKFATRVVKQRGWVNDEELNEFLAAGYTRQNVIEVLLGVTLKTLSNYTNHIAGTPLDAAFSAKAWQAPSSDAA